MSETESLIYLQWNQLMNKVRVILGGPQPGLTDDENRGAIQRARYEARGIAEVLALQMKPFMESADDVVRHAVKRFKNPDHEVPGLGEHLWDPMKNPDGSLKNLGTSAAASKPRAPKPAAPAPDVPDKTKQAIKDALASGILTKEVVAGMYKMTVAQIEGIIAS